jgi:imidazolonepropionase-like amidohydrolase
VDAAHALGMKIAAHGHGKLAIDAAVRLGVDSIEHGTYADAESFKLMKANGTYFIATLLTTEKLYDAAKNRPETLNPSTVAKVLAMGSSLTKLTRAHEAGVKIAFGSDTGQGENVKEAALMVKAGLTPAEVIAAATTSAADLIGSTEIGAVQAGRYADIIAVAGIRWPTSPSWSASAS